MCDNCPEPELDDLTRAELAEVNPMAAVVARVHDRWLAAHHGILAASDHSTGDFLNLLAAEGYRVLPIIRCASCADSGAVCENHPHHPWAGMTGGPECCGGAGMPCPDCCDPIPEDGTRRITDAFTPRVSGARGLGPVTVSEGWTVT